MHYLLFYEKAPEFVQREPAHQAAHLAHVFEAVERGELLLGGPLADSTDGANVLLFQSDDAIAAEAFATADPYVQHGIVTHWRVRPWQTVVGPGAACPLPGSESDRH
jgi:uncharacterized protein YciI